MGYRVVILILLVLVGNNSYCQTYRVVITSDVDFQMSISNSLQTKEIAKNHILASIPTRIKELTLHVYTIPPRDVAIQTGTRGDQESYHIYKKGDSIIVKNQNYTKIDRSQFMFSFYREPQKIFIDSTKRNQSCRITDSAINQITINISLLKKKDYITKYLSDVLKYKCLNMSQIRSITYRMPDEESKVAFLKSSFDICIDRTTYQNLSNTLTMQYMATDFIQWVQKKKRTSGNN